MPESKVITEFDTVEIAQQWRIVNDGVMGGRSEGRFSVTPEGIAVFSGRVSLENNGGFTMVRCGFRALDATPFDRAVLRVRGDGKRYQFRVKSHAEERHAYVQYFTTSGEWEEIVLSFDTFYPTFRGRNLSMPNYPGERIAEVALLIGNKTAEEFRLEIDRIELR